MKILSPLRYPGGKGQMYDEIEYIIRANRLSDKIYVEPFAGGFALGLSLLKNGIVAKTIINDVDFHIFAFWKVVFNAPEKLISKIIKTEINIEEWKRQKSIYKKCDKRSLVNIAFSTLFLNRTNFSGVIKGGPIGGISQKGKYKLGCRFDKERIVKQISEISKFKDCVEIYNLDAKCLIKEVLSEKQNNLFINFDPPYVKKGKSLYTNFYKEEDHIELEKYISEYLSCDWIMTYDDDPLIHKIYQKNLFFRFDIGYSANNHKNGTELFISQRNYAHNIKFST